MAPTQFNCFFISIAKVITKIIPKMYHHLLSSPQSFFCDNCDGRLGYNPKDNLVLPLTPLFIVCECVGIFQSNFKIHRKE